MLWKLFSEILEKNISKTNFRSVIEELQQSRAIDTDDLFSSSHSQISENNQSKDDRVVCDWNKAPENNFFYGRTSELKILRKWLIEERCRLIAVVGMGGIGKTALSLRCAKNLQHEFEFVIWRQ